MAHVLLVVTESLHLINFVLVGILVPATLRRFTLAAGLALSYLTIGGAAAVAGLNALFSNSQSTATGEVRNILDWFALIIREHIGPV
jgi:hypothetical protein